jgi:glycerophosphoryl diester phosphodiesterase
VDRRLAFLQQRQREYDDYNARPRRPPPEPAVSQVALVRRLNCLNRLCIGSEHDAIAQEISRALPDALLFYPANALASFVLPTKAGEPPDDDARYTVLDMPLHWQGVKLFDAELAAVARQHGKWVNIWTVDDEAEMKQAIADGVGGIMTDRPDVLRAVLSAA